MLGPTCFDLLKHYTKIHIYPVDINGAIIGAIGKVSFQAIDPSQKKIPTSTQDWNREYFFYAEVVWNVQNAIRRHYRELHLKLSAKAIRRGLGVLFDGREISRDRLAEFVDDLNISARDIARLCPHPAHEFFLVGRSAKIKPHGFGGDGWFKADLDDRLAIGFRRNKDWEVFRSMTLPGSKYVVEEHSRALQGKLQEEILAAINRPSVTNVYSIATKKVTS